MTNLPPHLQYFKDVNEMISSSIKQPPMNELIEYLEDLNLELAALLIHIKDTQKSSEALLTQLSTIVNNHE